MMTGTRIAALGATIQAARGWAVLWDPSWQTWKGPRTSRISSPRETRPIPAARATVSCFARESSPKSSPSTAPSSAPRPNGARSSTTSRRNWKRRTACSTNPPLPQPGTTLAAFRPKQSTRITNSSPAPRSIHWASRTSSARPCCAGTCTDSSSTSVSTIASAPWPSRSNTTNTDPRKSRSGWKKSAPRGSLPGPMRRRPGRRSIRTSRTVSVQRRRIGPSPGRWPRRWWRTIDSGGCFVIRTLKSMRRPRTSSCAILVALRRRGCGMIGIWTAIWKTRMISMRRRWVVKQEEEEATLVDM
mmetsp:Transcript_13795/g.29353  ORF Transcript_13795/g.29353 Transcript_13795/m.29353 type:complete len:301 (+) Transcript_13795:1031-1933(+)